MTVQMDQILWEIVKVYHEGFLAEYPDRHTSLDVSVVATLRALEVSGHAEHHSTANGDVIWKATPQLLCSTGLEDAGPLASVGPKLN